MLTSWRNFAHRSAKRGGHRWTRRIIISVYSLKSYFFCLYLDLWRFEKLVGVNIFFPDCNVPSFKVQKWAFMVSTISKVKTLASFKNLSWFRPRTSHTGNRLLLKGVWMGVPHLDNTFWLLNMKQLNFRHFNTNSKKIIWSSKFFPERSKNGLFSISRSFRPCILRQFISDGFRRLPKIPEDQRRFPKTNEEVRPLPKMSEEPSKDLTVLSSETANIKKIGQFNSK